MYNATGDEIYILSFCGQHNDPDINANGLLSQWRAYGAGGGYAIVFNTKKLERLLEKETKSFEYKIMLLCDLIYSNNEKKFKEELSKDLSIIVDANKLFFDHRALDFDKIEKSYYSFVNCISRYKHYGFSEENEVRVVALPAAENKEYLKIANEKNITPQTEKERKYRKKNDQNLPYIELFNSIETELPIERIIVGPHKEKENRAAALRVMLRNKNIEITCSDIPYVG